MNRRITLIIVLAFSYCYLPLLAADVNVVPNKIQTLARSALPVILKTVYSDDKEQNFISGFSAGYLSGLTNTRSTYGDRPWLKKGPWDRGFEKGRSSSLAELNSGKTTATLIDFGFTEVTQKGYLFLEFEQNEFRPIDSQEIWWLSSLVSLSRYEELIAKAGGHHQIMRLKGLHDFDRRYIYGTLKGYLSPKKDTYGPGYGHFGRYDREFVVNQVINIEQSGK